MATESTRTKEWLRAQGFVEGTVEQRIPIPGASFQPLRDFLNFADIIAVDLLSTIAVQCTSTSNTGARVRKILAEPRAWIWAAMASREIWVVGWRKYAEPLPGFRKLWRPTVHKVMPEHFDGEMKRAAVELLESYHEAGKKLLRGLTAAG